MGSVVQLVGYRISLKYSLVLTMCMKSLNFTTSAGCFTPAIVHLAFLLPLALHNQPGGFLGHLDAEGLFPPHHLFAEHILGNI